MDALIKGIIDVRSEPSKVVSELHSKIEDIGDHFKTFPFDNKDKGTQYLVPFDKSTLDSAIKRPIKDCGDFCILIRLLVYELIDGFKHYILKEKDEVFNPKTNINYILTIADNEIKIKLFVVFLMVFSLEAKIRNLILCKTENKKTNVGIDFEFRLRVEALMQLNFETVSDSNMDTNSFLWIVHPSEFNEKDLALLFDYLLLNTTIYKIMHGPESLDLPVLFNLIFKKDREKIMKFTSKLIDTRYLCETYRQSVGEDRNCKYEFAIKYFGVIDEKKYDEMANDKYLMGPVQDINWDIHHLSSHHIKYALHDVIFLKHYVYAIYDKIKENTPQFLNTYSFILPLMRFMVCERHEFGTDSKGNPITVSDVIDSVKGVVNKINNFHIRLYGKQFNLNSIYESVIKDMVLPELDIHLDLIMTVVYVRKKLSILLKYIVYSIVSKNYRIYIKKDEKYENRLNMDGVYKSLTEYGYDKVKLFIEGFELEASKKISIIYPQ